MEEMPVLGDEVDQVIEKCNRIVGPGGDGSELEAMKNNLPGEKNDDTRAEVMHQVQILMQELDEKRRSDKQMVEEFRGRLQTMVDQLCQQLEQRLLMQHDETNKAVETKLQRLNEVVERVCGLESELNNFKNAVGTLFNDLNP